MTKVWKKKSNEEIKAGVFDALGNNINYDKAGVLGIPASYLDSQIFNQDASFLKDAPFMSAMVQNPNHIGCHTLGKSESFFKGTQTIEKEVIEICAIDILKGNIDEQDGYIASGGTEANIQAIWIYRNYFRNELAAKINEIAIICSEDSHYSMDKAANLLMLDIYKIPIEKEDRTITKIAIETLLDEAKLDGKKYFIVIANMMTTMFGSVDDVEIITTALKEKSYIFKLHIDGAYGGFYYPFSNEKSLLTFENQDISSFTLDAHKMAQAPYGTGVFLIRKGLIQHVNTQQASYVEGEDYTLIGNRSGANSMAVWMILVKNGLFGWFKKVYILQKRTIWICERLENLNIEFYRNPM
jgi:tyrosine decarboxylase/aspartate 1-decarboxylase